MDESELWSKFKAAYDRHNKPLTKNWDSAWRVDNKLSPGMADVFMVWPAPSWVELKTGTCAPAKGILDEPAVTIKLRHYLTKPQLRFLNLSRLSGGNGLVLIGFRNEDNGLPPVKPFGVMEDRKWLWKLTGVGCGPLTIPLDEGGITLFDDLDDMLRWLDGHGRLTEAVETPVDDPSWTLPVSEKEKM